MGAFFKMFFASLLALIIFSLVAFFLSFSFIAGIATKSRPVVENNSVLSIDLSQQYNEQQVENPLASLSSSDELTIPGVYDVVRLIQFAATDPKIKGIYLKAGINPNGFASCDEIRNALADFKRSDKFIISYGETINQKSYHIINLSDKLYINPKGFLEWSGFSANLIFLKGTLEKLEIEPQIFYAGKFKSATEPFRTDKMTNENRLQTTEWLSDLYNYFLFKTSEARGVDTSTLHNLANEGVIRKSEDAVDNNLADALKYDDEVKDEIKATLGLSIYNKINFVSINKYYKAARFRRVKGERIALIYAQGDIIDGKGEQQFQIGSSDYVNLIRKARLDNTVKAVVFRVNSGGGRHHRRR